MTSQPAAAAADVVVLRRLRGVADQCSLTPATSRRRHIVESTFDEVEQDGDLYPVKICRHRLWRFYTVTFVIIPTTSKAHHCVKTRHSSFC